jgi:hypothetical protein
MVFNDFIKLNGIVRTHQMEVFNLLHRSHSLTVTVRSQIKAQNSNTNLSRQSRNKSPPRENLLSAKDDLSCRAWWMTRDPRPLPHVTKLPLTEVFFFFFYSLIVRLSSSFVGPIHCLHRPLHSPLSPPMPLPGLKGGTCFLHFYFYFKKKNLVTLSKIKILKKLRMK